MATIEFYFYLSRVKDIHLFLKKSLPISRICKNISVFDFPVFCLELSSMGWYWYNTELDLSSKKCGPRHWVVKCKTENEIIIFLSRDISFDKIVLRYYIYQCVIYLEFMMYNTLLILLRA